MTKNKKILLKKLIILFVFLILIFSIANIVYKKIKKNGHIDVISSNGRIESREVLISTKFSGRVIEILKDEGDFVKKGDLLLSIDDRSLSAEIEAQKARLIEIDKNVKAIDANILATKSDIKFYSKEVERTKNLIKQKFSTQVELDKNNNYLDKSNAQLKVLEANKKAMLASYDSLLATIKSMEINLEDMKIYAPDDGIILYKLVENGEIVGQGGKLFVMYNPNNLYMTIYMNAELSGQVRLGSESLIKLDAFKSRAFPAKVTFVAENAEFTPKEVETKVEREKLVFRIKLTVNNNESMDVKPGMPGEGYIKINKDINLEDYIK